MDAAAEMNTIETKFAKECRIGMKWRLKEEDLKNLQDGFLQSKTFDALIPGVKYCLGIYPNGLDESTRNCVGVSLSLQFDAVKSVTANFTVSVKSASNITEFVNRIYNDSPRGWTRKLCSPDDLFNPEKKYFVDKIMEIELEGTLSPQGIKPKAVELISLVKVLWEMDEGKDVTVIVKEQELKIHKWILCAQSPVFKTEMESPFIEAQENRIIITDFAYETVKAAIEFCYERKIKEYINEKSGYELLHFADKYNIKPMHDLVQNELIEKISETNVVVFANMSITSNAENLQEFCICFLAKSAANQAVVIDDIDKLDPEIALKVFQRSYFSTSG